MEGNRSEYKKIYRVTHLETGEQSYIASSAPLNACAGCGWQFGDCMVEAVQTFDRRSSKEPLGVYVKLACSVCSFQYAECTLPLDQQCPCSPDTPDWKEWLIQVSKAHLCDHVGVELEHKDYHFHQKWLPMDEAVKELSPK